MHRLWLASVTFTLLTARSYMCNSNGSQVLRMFMIPLFHKDSRSLANMYNSSMPLVNIHDALYHKTIEVHTCIPHQCMNDLVCCFPTILGLTV